MLRQFIIDSSRNGFYLILNKRQLKHPDTQRIELPHWPKDVPLPEVAKEREALAVYKVAQNPIVSDTVVLICHSNSITNGMDSSIDRLEGVYYTISCAYGTGFRWEMKRKIVKFFREHVPTVPAFATHFLANYNSITMGPFLESDKLHRPPDVFREDLEEFNNNFFPTKLNSSQMDAAFKMFENESACTIRVWTQMVENGARAKLCIDPVLPLAYAISKLNIMSKDIETVKDVVVFSKSVPKVGHTARITSCFMKQPFWSHYWAM
uniref:Glucuronosyltransferase n=2 Tax=Bursaphelenchus xylophilus TaxID=6326 RepID=A0A1I7S1Z9_BURXY